MKKAFGAIDISSTLLLAMPLLAKKALTLPQAPLLVEDEQHATGQGHQRSRLIAEDRQRVLAVVSRRSFDNAVRGAGPNDHVLGAVVCGLLHDKVGLEEGMPGACTVLPGVKHALVR